MVQYPSGRVRYRAVVPIGEGKRWTSPVFDTPDEAVTAASRYRAREGRLGASLTLAEGMERLRVDMRRRGLRPASLKSYEARYRSLLSAGVIDPTVQLATLNRHDVEAHAQKRAQTVTLGTIWAGDILCLRRIVALALEEGLLRQDPLTGVKAPRFRQGRYDSSTADAVLAIVAKMRADTNRNSAAAARDAAIVELLLGTGIRRAELGRLTVRDVDLTTRTLRVDGKTGNRELPLRALGLRAAELLVERAGADGKLVRSVHTIDEAMRVLNRDRYHSGVRISPHVLRHTFATECVRRGVQPFDLATILGHADIQQTMRYYHAHADRIAAAMELFGT